MASAHGSSLTTRREEMTTTTIGTHHGMFQCDEALACFMLRLLPTYRDAKIIRTTDPDVLKTCDVVVDVGGTYYHPSKRYDHHQRDFEETMQSLCKSHPPYPGANYPWTTPLSSAGLVYFHYGHRVLAQIMGKDESDDLEKRIWVYAKVYEEFVQAIDASDNAISLMENKTVAKYSITTSLSARVGRLEITNKTQQAITDLEQQEEFYKAMELTGSEFEDKVKYFTDIWWPAKTSAEEARKKDIEVFPSSRLVHLLQSGPCVDRIFTVDEVHGTHVTRKLYRIARELPGDKWHVQLVSTKEEPHIVHNLLKIGTHDGSFHCDEALACFMLKQLPEYKDAQVIRTSDPAVLDTCDVVVDVGGEYNHARKKYDHHQSGFNKTMNSLDSAYPWKTPLSSAGLVYFHYGRRVLAEIMGSDGADEEKINRVYSRVYREFVEAVDAIDNGIVPVEGRRRFVITTCLGDRISNLNHSWNDAHDARIVDVHFCKAMELTGSEFKDKVDYFGTVWWPARTIVRNAFERRYETDQSGEVLHLDPACTWKDHLYDVEVENDLKGKIKFVVFKDNNGKQFVIKCVSRFLITKSKNNRLLLPTKWAGLSGEILRRASGVEGSSSVHRAGFVGYGETLGSVLEMARKTLEMG